MSKKIIILIIVIILLITTFVFIAMWRVRNKTTNEDNVSSQEITVPIVPVEAVDSDIKAIEDNLGLIREDDFNVDNLSDSNVGL